MTELDDLVARLRRAEPAVGGPAPARFDGRLLAPAAFAWAGALAMLLGAGVLTDGQPRRHLATTALVVVGILTTATVIAQARRPQRAARRVLVTALLGLTAGTFAAALHIAALSADPVAGWAAQGRHATVVASVASEPLASKGPAWQSHGMSLVRMRAVSVEVGDEQVHVDLPILARLASDDLVLAPIGAQVSMRGALHASSGTGAAFIIAAHDVDIEAPPGRVDAAANLLRDGLVRALAPIDPGAASLVHGLAVGGTALMPALLEEDMRTVGLSHLTAVSGGNVSIVLGAILLVSGLLRAPLGVRIVLALLGLAFFIVLVRPEPSVVRAAVMGAVAVLALATGGRRSGPSVLAVAVLVLVVLSPPLAASWGFALSVMATAGIVLLAPVIEDHLTAFLERVAPRRPLAARLSAAPPIATKAVAMTTAAQLMTAPLIVAMGATVGWVALPANLLAAPAVAPVTILGLLAALASAVSPPLAGALAAIAAVPAAWVAWVAQWAASLPGAVAPIPVGWGGAALLLGMAALSVVVGMMMGMRRRGMPAHRAPERDLPGRRLLGRRRVRGAVLVALAIVAAIFVIANTRGRMPDGWLLVACDVGQGDALVLRSSAGSTVLVDAGPEPGAVDRCLGDLGVDEIDVVVLSHYDSDHIGGLAGAMHGRSVHAALVSPVTTDAERVDEVRALLADTDVTPARQGMRIELEGLSMQVLWPASAASGSRSAQNDGSVVVLANVDGVSTLLTGDIEQAAQAQLARIVPAGGVDIVKVPHHGSRNLDPALAEATHPLVALFSVGADNDYGHPHPDSLASWSEAGAVIGRTDEQGTVAVVREPSGGLTLATAA